MASRYHSYVLSPPSSAVRPLSLHPCAAVCISRYVSTPICTSYARHRVSNQNRASESFGFIQMVLYLDGCVCVPAAINQIYWNWFLIQIENCLRAAHLCRVISDICVRNTQEWRLFAALAGHRHFFFCLYHEHHLFAITVVNWCVIRRRE